MQQVFTKYKIKDSGCYDYCSKVDEMTHSLKNDQKRNKFGFIGLVGGNNYLEMPLKTVP